ncbi:MAG: extracellular solute-binding protein, partial [Treponema sp.]|nr:extracellular solute-binding protein [Treponema sp.]
MAKTDAGNGIAVKLRKAAIRIAVIFVLAFGIFLLTGARVENFSDRWYGYDLTIGLGGRENTYVRYRLRHGDVPAGTRDRPIDIASWTAADGATLLTDFVGETVALRTEERGFVEFTIYLEQAGLYNLHIEYFPIPAPTALAAHFDWDGLHTEGFPQARGIDIERRVRINGEIPFLGADRLMFRRIWGDAPGGRRMDNQGNEVRPSQIEFPRWEGAWFRDLLGHAVYPYMFHFSAGYNTIRLEGVNEPMAIRAFSLKAPSPPVSHSEWLAGFSPADFRNSDTRFMMRVQGEDATRRSDPSLAPVHDRSSGATYPPAPSRIRFNMIGGHAWRVAGQWIEWDFEVPEDGMYRISIKARQNYNRGFVSNRAIIVNGEIPSRELSAVPFTFSNRWQLVTLADDDGEYLMVPLRAGANTIRMEVVMGRLGGMLSTIEESVYRLNEIYRQILVLTGPDPDPFRDYRIEAVYPHLIPAMQLESRILWKLVDDLTEYSGERSPQTAAAMTLARQLENFVRRPDRIPRQLINFRNNISALGDSLLALAQGQLDVDYIVISAADAELPGTGESFFGSIAHEFRSFIASFFMDYDSLGDVFADGEGVITVWMLAGREQSTILKRMIDDTFSPETGIRVNVRLVAPEALMPAVVAGIGPDLALTVQQGDPVNYAIRNAVLDLSQFEGFDNVVAQFCESVITPFRFQDGVFGLPETQFFHVMFYRRDILAELEIETPQTWDDLIS